MQMSFLTIVNVHRCLNAIATIVTYLNNMFIMITCLAYHFLLRCVNLERISLRESVRLFIYLSVHYACAKKVFFAIFGGGDILCFVR